MARLRKAGCVFAEEEARLLLATARDHLELAELAARRVAGFPLEHVIGWAEFHGRRVEIDPGVFVPRPRTEFLVGHAVALAGRVPGAVVVDLCCGSGALGLALVAELVDIELYAADIDPAAVRCARRNLAGAGSRVYEGDLFDPLPVRLRGMIDVLVANVPYVPSEAVDLLPAESRLHEPRVALDGGADGLDVVRRVAAEAFEWLTPGGHLLVEATDRQAPLATAIFAGARLVPAVAHSAEREATVVIATRP